MAGPKSPGGRTIGPFGHSRLTERPLAPKARSRARKAFSRRSFCSGSAAGQGAVAEEVAAARDAARPETGLLRLPRASTRTFGGGWRRRGGPGCAPPVSHLYIKSAASPDSQDEGRYPPTVTWGRP